MSQVGTDVALRYSIDSVASGAWTVGENLRAATRGSSIGRCRTGRRLDLFPTREVGGSIDENPESHVGVRESAEFRALPKILAGHIGDEIDLVFLTRNHIAFPAQTRNPKTMNHVGGYQLETNRPIRRQMQFVCGEDIGPVVVAELPPPLMRDHGDRKFVRYRRSRLSSEDQPNGGNRDH